MQNSESHERRGAIVVVVFARGRYCVRDGHSLYLWSRPTPVRSISSCDLPRRNSFTCCSAHTTASMDTSPPLFFDRLAPMFGKTGKTEDTISLRRNRTDNSRECRLHLCLHEWIIRPFPRSHSRTHTCLHTLHSLAHSVTQSLTHSLTHSLTNQLTRYSLVHFSLAHSLAHPPTRPLAHTITRPL